jgi:DNA-binding beta-propeller fold protein YncE
MLRESARVAANVCAALAIVCAGCSKKNETNNPNPQTSSLGHGDIASVSALAQSAAFYSPLDGAPSPDGKTVYFTAMAQEGAAIFKIATAGGDATKLAAGDPLVAPFGIAVSSDGSTLFVVDSGVEAKGQKGIGTMFSLSASGGTPTEISAAAGTNPRSLEIGEENGADMIYWTGIDPADGQASVFKMTAAGANRTIIAKGAPLGDPSGIAIAKSGAVYIADSTPTASASSGVIALEGGSMKLIASGMRFGHPAGVALVQDESALLVSGLDPQKGSSAVFRVDLASGKVSSFDQGISMNKDSAGLHRAKGADVYAWANSAGETRGDGFLAGGTVYLLKGKTAAGN